MLRRSLCIAALTLFAVTDSHSQCFESKIVSPLGAGALFGSSVSVAGSSMIVGAPGHDSVVFYERIAGVWTEGATFTGASGSSYGYDVALNGNFALVGAPLHDAASTATTDSGAVQLFIQGPPGTWTPAPLFLPPNAQDEGHYGWAVDTDGTRLAVGVPGQNNNRGTVRIYTVVSGQLSQTQNIPAVNVAGFGSRWGYDVSIDGLTLAIGAPRANVIGFTNNGMGAFFRLQFGSFSFKNYFTFNGNNVLTGSAVAVSGSRGVIQAIGVQDPLLWMEWTGTEWVIENQSNGAFGREALAMSGNRALQGLPVSPDITFTSTVGGLRMFTNDGGPEGWGDEPFITSLGEITEGLGESVALDGDTGVVGEPFRDDNGVDSGAVRVYDTSVTSWEFGSEDFNTIPSAVNGTPFLFLDGTVCGGLPLKLRVKFAAPNALTTIVVGLSYLGVPFKGGTLGPQPDILLPFMTDASGDFEADVLFPTGIPNSFKILMQAFIVDAGAPKGLAATYTRSATTPSPAP